jgi:hypothetical protein
MAAAKIATLPRGTNQHAPIGASSQAEAAKSMKVGRRSVQRAKDVIERGSKPLQQAVNIGDISVSRAAAVVDLPKSEQLAAAKALTKKPEPERPEINERWVPDEDEEEKLALVEKEYTASIDKVMAADDKLTAAHAEIKRQAAEIAVLVLARNGYQNQCAELIRRVKSLQRENDKLKRRAA